MILDYLETIKILKILYLLPIELDKYPGVLIKIHSQVQAWVKLGNNVCVLLILPANSMPIENTPLREIHRKGLIKAIYLKKNMSFSFELLRYKIGLSKIFNKALKLINLENPNIIYARASIFQPFYKKLGHFYKLILEVNTDFKSEIKLQAYQSPKFLLRYLYFKIFGSEILKNVDGICSVTFEIDQSIKSTKSVVVPNSIDVNLYSDVIKFKKKNKKKEKSIFFIGSPNMPWHGVDILEKLAIKLPEITFHVVGISISNPSTKPKNMIYHGFLKKEEYLPILINSTAAIGTLALHRKKMNEACPLKVREYVACRIPVIVPYLETTFKINGYPSWALVLENNEKKILAAADKISTFINQCDQLILNESDVNKFVHVDDIECARIEFFKKIYEEDN